MSIDVRNGQRPSNAMADNLAGHPALSRKNSEPEPNHSGVATKKRSRVEEDVDPSPHLPSSDRSAWYYPGRQRVEDGEESDELPSGVYNGNWGKKDRLAARFVRRGHIAAWAPTRDDYDVEQRARKRLRLILPEVTGEPLPRDAILPHLRSPSPPMTAPYATSAPQHQTYTDATLDPHLLATFRSNLFVSLERSASELIQSEIALTRALGRFWAAVSETDHISAKNQRHEYLKEQQARHQEQQRLQEIRARLREPFPTEPNPYSNGMHIDSDMLPLAGDLPPNPSLHDSISSRDCLLGLFTLPTSIRLEYPAGPGGTAEVISLTPANQTEIVSRSIVNIRELQEDSKECMERLEEIREMLGKVKGLRDSVWNIVRSKAIEEMEAALEVD